MAVSSDFCCQLLSKQLFTNAAGPTCTFFYFLSSLENKEPSFEVYLKSKCRIAPSVRSHEAACVKKTQ